MARQEFLVDNDRDEIYDKKKSKKSRGWRDERHQENRKRDYKKDYYDEDETNNSHGDRY